MIEIDQESSKKLKNIVKNAGFFQNSEISISIFNFNNKKLIELNPHKFIYPASVYKVFVATEVINQIELERFGFDSRVEIQAPNDADNEAHSYPTEIYPLLRAGDNITIDMLLTLMLGRSDNTAANTLIDLVSRTAINNNIIKRYNWHGSEITRKFLNRKYEEKAYKNSPSTVSCSRHLASFLNKIENNALISPFVSSKLKQYMSLNFQKKDEENWLKDLNYGKGGWLQVNSSNPFKILFGKRYIRYQSQIGVINNGDQHYAISILSKYNTSNPDKHLKFSIISDKILEILK